MLDHDERRLLLLHVVMVLEPYASAAMIQHYTAHRHQAALPLLRIYVDLERLVRMGDLVRLVKPRLGGAGRTFFWETPGLVLVEVDRVPPRLLATEAPVAVDLPPSPDGMTFAFSSGVHGSVGFQPGML